MLIAEKIPGVEQMSVSKAKATTKKTSLSLHISSDTRWNRDPKLFMWDQGFNPVDRQTEEYGGVARQGISIDLEYHSPSSGDTRAKFKIFSEKKPSRKGSYWPRRVVDEGVIIELVAQADGSHLLKGDGNRFQWEIECEFKS